MAPQQLSPFLTPGPVSKLQSLATLHLRRDQILSTILTDHDETDAGYREGPVINTRFGSFPHSTLVGLPWGCQVRASVVDTGSRGRKGQDRKRKRDGESSGGSSSEDGDNAEAIKTPLTASSGFIHLLPPTPESWTTSLPHRTQVVYTPDYSFILHRLRARPGSVLIEAGSGSGSFTHAAARAIYNGYSESVTASQMGSSGLQKRLGKVWSYEFHQQRAEKIQKEIQDHQLKGVVEVVHRDVYRDGFSIAKCAGDHRSIPGADAVFLDVPAPWLALRHLKRTATAKKSVEEVEDLTGAQTMSSEAGPAVTADFNVTNVSNELKLESPLNPDVPVTLCTFSPCIEQVQRTVATLREMGWIDIEMVTVAHKRIEVRRERYGVQEAGQRGVNASAANVKQALERLREIEGQQRHSQPQHEVNNLNDPKECNNSSAEKDLAKEPNGHQTSVKRKLYKEGRLVHRTETELKTHTSYLVFALLPREWTAEEEERAQRRWPLYSKSHVNSLADSAKKGRATRVRNGVGQDNSHEDGAPPQNRINGRTATFPT